MTLLEKLRPLAWLLAETKVTDPERHFLTDLCTKLMSDAHVTNVDICKLRAVLQGHPWMVDSLDKDGIFEAIEELNPCQTTNQV